MIKNETATQIARTYRDLEAAEELLEKVTEEIEKEKERRGFHGEIHYTAKRCRLEFPSSADSYKCFQVDPAIAKSVIVAHIIDQKAKLEKLNEIALLELKTAKLEDQMESHGN